MGHSYLNTIQALLRIRFIGWSTNKKYKSLAPLNKMQNEQGGELLWVQAIRSIDKQNEADSKHTK